MVLATGRRRARPQGAIFHRERCRAGARWAQSRRAVARDRGQVQGGKAPSRVRKGPQPRCPMQASEQRLWEQVRTRWREGPESWPRLPPDNGGAPTAPDGPWGQPSRRVCRAEPCDRQAQARQTSRRTWHGTGAPGQRWAFRGHHTFRLGTRSLWEPNVPTSL